MDFILPDKKDLYSDYLETRIPYRNHEIDLEKFLSAFQEVSLSHVTKLGLGDDYKDQNDFYYVVCRIEVRFLRPWKENEKVYFVTYPGVPRAIEIYRYGYVLNEKMEVLSTITSLWVLLSQSKRKIKPALFYKKEFLRRLPDLEKKNPNQERLFALDFSSLPLEKKGTYLVIPEDIDANLHMNNSKYMKIVQDYRLSSQKVRSFEIDFEKENRLGDKLDIYTLRKDKEEYYLGTKENQETSFRCKLTLE